METERTTLSDNETILNVLLIEQDPMDAIIIRKTLGEDKKTYSIRQVRDGVAAIDYLRNREIGKNNPTPDLIVMAENIPGLNGGQLMMLLNSDAALRQIPLILIQPNHDKSSTAGRFRLLAGKSLRTAPNANQLNPFIYVINNYFKNKPVR